MFETLKKILTPVEGIDADQARAYIAENEEGTYTLLDVRQPKEYEKAHIPGAELIPLPILTDKLDSLDRKKPVIVYCAIGGRSRVAAQMLAGYDFEKVYNLNGGIQAWNGLTAEGPVELNLDLIRGDETPDQVVKLAYGMEVALGDFYRTLKVMTPDRELGSLVEKLASVEDRHKEFLLDVLKEMGHRETTIEAMDAETAPDIVEGGFSGKDLVERNRSVLQSVPAMLDLSMMLEAQALDLYLRFAGKIESEASKAVLRRIAEEEKNHLAALGRLRDQLG